MTCDRSEEHVQPARVQVHQHLGNTQPPSRRPAGWRRLSNTTSPITASRCSRPVVDHPVDIFTGLATQTATVSVQGVAETLWKPASLVTTRPAAPSDLAMSIASSGLTLLSRIISNKSAIEPLDYNTCTLFSRATSTSYSRFSGNFILSRHFVDNNILTCQWWWHHHWHQATAICFSSPVIFLLVDACVGLNWLLVSFFIAR